MEKKTCPNPASYHVPWGSDIISCCMLHANNLAKLSAAMGAPLKIKMVITDSKCEMPDDLEEGER